MGKVSAKYKPLYEHLYGNATEVLTLSLAQLEQLLGSALPKGAYLQRAWWANRAHGSAQAGAWMQAGYRFEALDLAAQTVTFVKANRRRGGYTVSGAGDSARWDAAMIKSLRQHMQLNQTQFAEHLGVRQQTVSEWEVGVYEPTRATCKHLALVAESSNFRYGTGPDK